MAGRSRESATSLYTSMKKHDFYMADCSDNNFPCCRANVKLFSCNHLKPWI